MTLYFVKMLLVYKSVYSFTFFGTFMSSGAHNYYHRSIELWNGGIPALTASLVPRLLVLTIIIIVMQIKLVAVHACVAAYVSCTCLGTVFVHDFVNILHCTCIVRSPTHYSFTPHMEPNSNAICTSQDRSPTHNNYYSH